MGGPCASSLCLQVDLAALYEYPTPQRVASRRLTATPHRSPILKRIARNCPRRLGAIPVRLFETPMFDRLPGPHPNETADHDLRTLQLLVLWPLGPREDSRCYIELLDWPFLVLKTFVHASIILLPFRLYFVTSANLTVVAAIQNLPPNHALL